MIITTHHRSVCVSDELETRTMMTGTATKLESRFRLTYSMILNLLRVEDLKVEDMMKRSFAEFHAQKSVPEALQAVAKIQVGELRNHHSYYHYYRQS
jgi:antiviral helicase SKI2